MLRINRTKRGNAKKALGQFVINRKDKKDELRKIDALIRFHFKIDPDKLTDNKWAELWQQLQYALEQENQRFKM